MPFIPALPSRSVPPRLLTRGPDSLPDPRPRPMGGDGIPGRALVGVRKREPPYSEGARTKHFIPCLPNTEVEGRFTSFDLFKTVQLSDIAFE